MKKIKIATSVLAIVTLALSHASYAGTSVALVRCEKPEAGDKDAKFGLNLYKQRAFTNWHLITIISSQVESASFSVTWLQSRKDLGDSVEYIFGMSRDSQHPEKDIFMSVQVDKTLMAANASGKVRVKGSLVRGYGDNSELVPIDETIDCASTDAGKDLQNF